jgi:hypothetical protein
MAKEFSKVIIDECLEAGKLFIKPKMKTVIETVLDESLPVQVIKTSCDIGAFKAIEKLKEWMSINLNEQIFYEELRVKRFKKKTDTAAASSAATAAAAKKKPSFDEEPSSTTEKPVFNTSYLMPSVIFNKIKVSFIYYYTC